MAFDWTDANITKLKELAARSLTARAIGEQLGTSRNSIIGKCGRLGIPLQSRIKSVRPPRPTRRVAPVKEPPEPRSAVRLAPKPQPKPVIVSRNVTPIRLSELPKTGCKYPIDRGTDGEWRMCSLPRNEGPYCDDHHDVCFRSDGRRKEAR